MNKSETQKYVCELREEIARLESSYHRHRSKICDLENENHKLKQRIAELESKEAEKSTKYTTVIVAKEINGQTYVKLDDFMSVVNDLQAEIGT